MSNLVARLRELGQQRLAHPILLEAADALEDYELNCLLTQHDDSKAQNLNSDWHGKRGPECENGCTCGKDELRPQNPDKAKRSLTFECREQRHDACARIAGKEQGCECSCHPDRTSAK